ncbi:MAG TPA: hypothetical protein VH120_03790 [Gemmataceae bacterium]|jgi:hypothetical protein|nr:hypothetical protein [Gemmataceae bacterium]
MTHRSGTHHWILAATMFLGSAGHQLARAEVILGPSQFGADINPYLRFAGGYNDTPANTVNNSGFYLPSLDLSGVGWRLPGIFSSAAWNVAMIDDRHFVGAWHTTVNGVVNVGDTINFRPAGTSSIVTRTIASVQNVPNADGSTSDVLLGTLNTPIPAGSGIAAYPITPAATYPQVIYAYGRQSEVGQNNVSGTQSGISFPIDGNPAHNEVLDALLFDYDQPGATGATSPDGLPSTVGNNEAYLNAGDSGGPSFVLVGGQLQLVGTHAGVTNYAGIGSTKPAGAQDDISFSFDSYLPDYAAAINAIITPEPSSLALGLFAAGGAVTGYLRSRRRSKSA